MLESRLWGAGLCRQLLEISVFDTRVDRAVECPDLLNRL